MNEKNNLIPDIEGPAKAIALQPNGKTRVRRRPCPTTQISQPVPVFQLAVDHEGEILESYVTKKRDKTAAPVFLKKALKRHGRAETIVTYGLRSYPLAMRELGNLDRRAMGRWLNNRAEDSHLPFRRRERAMLRFRQMKSLQKFASVHANVHNHVNLERHFVDRDTYKTRRSVALAEWQNLMA